jgi:MFS family permease
MVVLRSFPYQSLNETQGAVAIFFPFYMFVEVPSNLMMKRIGPRLWLPIIMLAWSVCTILMGLSHNYGGLMAARSALGLAEGGIFPGVSLLVTIWYRRNECGFRMASHCSSRLRPH